MVHNIYHMFHNVWQNILKKGFETYCTEMEALQKFQFAATMLPERIPTATLQLQCSLPPVEDSKSILTDSLLVASVFVSIYSNFNSVIAKLSFSIRLRRRLAVVQHHHHDKSWVLADALHRILQYICHGPWVRHACCSADAWHTSTSAAASSFCG